MAFNWRALLREPRVWLAGENLLLAINAQLQANGSPAVPPEIMSLVFALLAIVLAAGLGIEITRERQATAGALQSKSLNPHDTMVRARSAWWQIR